MEFQTAYAFGRSVALPYADTVAKVRAGLGKEGFGVLTEIEVAKKFEEKLGREFRDYIILGACNPALAWEAFHKELNIGTLLPCNVVVYQGDDGKSVVMVMDPVAVLQMIDSPGLVEIATTVRNNMMNMLNGL